MSFEYRVLGAEEIEGAGARKQTFCSDVLVGLSGSPKSLPSLYFYDEKGSRLFQRIMELPEYYLTRCELGILKDRAHELGRLLEERSFNLVELGAGDGCKAAILIRRFFDMKREFRYYPIDISAAAMRTLTRRLGPLFPSLEGEGIVAEYFDGLHWLNRLTERRNLVLFLGSNLGNFGKREAGIFLHNLWTALNPGDLVMIGFDLKKDIETMVRAYDDSQGVTAAFNLNLLDRINRELGGDFDLDGFRFYSTYDVFSGAIESYVVSLRDQVVFVRDIGQSFEFRSWEPIHTEYSYKYLDSDIVDLAAATGFRIEAQLFDSGRRFVDSVWRVIKRAGPDQAAE